MDKTLVLALFAIITPLAHADQGSFTNSGGSTSVSSGVIINSSVASPPGSLSINCPQTATSACAGGSFSFLSTDGTTSLSASFTTGRFVEGCSGGGRGGHVTCSWTFTGSFSGTLTVSGQTQAIVGSTYQAFGTGGAAASGSSGYNSSYTPMYFTDGNARILRSDDLSGTNAIAYGTQGSGVGQFYGPQGIALDSAGRIYIADIYNDRIVRIDDMNGTNWTSFGAYGTGTGQFVRPQSVSIDPAGHIWVLDNGNGRLIRMDDMNGTNWTQVGSAGSGVGQFISLSSAPGFDALGRIYLADAGNRWIARFDDLSFTNWTTLSQSQPMGPYIYHFGSPIGVVTDPAGRIYVADGTSVIRVDDMTGANWTSIGLGTFAPHTIAIDSKGMVVLGNGYNAQIVESEAAVLTSNITGLVQGVYVSVYGAVPRALPSPLPSAISYTPPAPAVTQNVGGPGTPLPVTIANFGGSPMNIYSLAVSSGFSETDNCSGAMLQGGSSCTASISFAPTTQGTVNGTFTVTDNSFNLGGTQVIAITGTGTAPAATVSPTSLSFSSQIVGTASAAKSVTLTNTGTGPMNVTSVSAAAPFSQTNNCTSLAAGAFCTVNVSFTPSTIGTATGTLTINDAAGTQTVSLSGRGSGPIQISPTELDFGSVAVGATSAPQAATVSNGGSVTVSIASIGASSGYSISSTTCGSTLAGGANCMVGVVFSPTAAGSDDGALSVAYTGALGSPATTALSGNGGVPASVSPASLNFGNVLAGTTSSPQSVTLANGSTAISIAGIAASAGFAISSSTCGSSLNGGASCTVNVTFSPTAIGPINGTLTFTDSALNSPQVVSLTGSGFTTASASPTSLSFGAIKAGHTSAPKTVTLTNSGGVAFGSVSATVSGTGFKISNDTCTGVLSSCSVSVTFTPAAKGTFNGTLTFADSASNSPQVVSLSGAGK
ncbi:MAG TPA: choice-of-anchor D domain-containing protein [Bryobacteraceae bacterium]|nr:choice-of-anchor D domain-containing protein [Bryobacteraceae bacterium]